MTDTSASPSGRPRRTARRRSGLLARATAFAACAGLAAGSAPAGHAAAIDYPASRTAPQVDDYFGTPVADPYRWLEDDRSAETRAWVEAQNRLTFGYLQAIPFRAQVLARLQALSNYPRDSDFFGKGEYLYFYRNQGLQNQSALYRQKGLGGRPELVLDPNTFSADGTIRLTSFTLSKDGRHAVYGRTAIAGSDWEEFRVLDTTTGGTLPEILRWSKFSTPAWEGDGFYYSRLPEPAAGTELTSVLRNQAVWFHRIGTPQGADTLVFEDRAHPGWLVDLRTTEDERFEVLFQEDLVHRGPRLAVRDARKPSKAFRPVVSEPGEATWQLVTSDGDGLLFHTNLDAPRGRLVRVDPQRPEPARWRTVLPEKPDRTLEAVSTGGGRLFARYLADVSSRIEIYRRDGRPDGSVALPGIGTASLAEGQAGAAAVFYSFSSLNQPPAVFRYDIASRRSVEIRATQVPGFDPARYQSRQVFFASKDGTRIPMSLVWRKGLVLDGRNPTLLYGYGGFNITLNPTFSATRVAWLEQGGVYAMVNLRGGGEYGEAWHEAGTRLHKQNVFDDCIAAAEYLIRERYTSPSRLVLQGGSNGGLLVGAVVNQRPDLFKVALPQVGVMDMLRFQKFSIGAAWVPDYGSSDDPAQFGYLLRYSPLHNIRAHGTYPAMLITTADHDDRVVPAHSFKYAATLQALAGPSSGPLLIRIATNSGHGASNLAKRLEEQADADSFAWFNLGVTPDFGADPATTTRTDADPATAMRANAEPSSAAASDAAAPPVERKAPR